MIKRKTIIKTGLLVVLAVLFVHCRIKTKPESREGIINHTEIETVPSPLFTDPNYHGSCDPEIVWNEHHQLWYIYYTARRPMQENTWLCTPIGVISSRDLINWNFEGYCWFDGEVGTKDATSTFWAPAVIAANDTLHMFVTWKPDTVPTAGAWGGQGLIVLYKTPLDNPVNGWQKAGMMHDSTQNAIDAAVYQNGDFYHIWFKGKEKDAQRNELYHLAGTDLKNWEDRGFSESDVFNRKVTGSDFEEAPYIFQWKNRFWLITDPHDGFFVYVSEGDESWKFQGTILKEGGTRNLDNTMARHCSVAVKNDRAFIFYHVEPWRRYDLEKKSGADRVPIFRQPLKNRESVLQMAELEIVNGKLVCDRNKPFSIQ